MDETVHRRVQAIFGTAPELVPGNDEEPGADGNGVFDESDDKVGNLERLYQASPPLIAGEGP
jgi:hypothetical protein